MNTGPGVQIKQQTYIY